MRSKIEEDFELELRCLPGVMGVGISHGPGGEVASVTLLVRSRTPENIEAGATQIASLYFPDVTVIVEKAEGPSARESAGARVVLAAVEFNETDGVSEVRLGYEGSEGRGRKGSGPLIGGAEATLAALRELGFAIPFYVLTVNRVDTAIGSAVIVTLRSLSKDDDGIGIARSEGDLVSSAKATLDALNRHLTLGPEADGQPPRSGGGA